MNNPFEMLKAIKSPKGALSLLANKNPQLAKTIEQMMNSGVPPQQAIKDFASKGQINASQLKQLKSLYTLAKGTGQLNFSIPNSIWEECETIMSGAKNNYF